jgi:CDP-glucose 4,6-dehydratase
MSFWSGKRVLLTGHTGFKGAWLTLSLVRLGARVTGFALPAHTEPALFDQLGLAREIEHRLGDIRDAALVQRVVHETRPDVVLHLAAQAIVLRSYGLPVDTWSINVMGTVHLLEALRNIDKTCGVVLVTSDKVYENSEWNVHYRESDRLGGHDPYSASKAACELAISCWRRSFFGESSEVRIASARAGNVIGGGDWSEYRIVPDLVRALTAGRPIEVRNPCAVRPWQHVLEPLGGYMLLAERLLASNTPGLKSAFNFGPSVEGERTVRELVEESLKHWPGTWHDASKQRVPHEAGRLALTVDRAHALLGWKPRWDFATSVCDTIDWYRTSIGASWRELRERSLRSIRDYEAAADAETRE